MSLLSIFSKKPAEPTSVQEALAGAPGQSSSRSKNRQSGRLNTDRDSESESVPEKKRARRRLIGALVMVLAVAVGLPMVLDSEPKRLNKDIAIQVSSRDEATTSSQHKEEMTQSLAQETKNASLPDSAKTSDIPSSESGGKESVSVSTESKPKLSETAVKVPPKNNDQSARALAILNGSDSASASANSTAAKANSTTDVTPRIVVQVGAFATQAKVDELRGKLKAAGIKSFTQKVATSSGDKIRVRIGPFADKESAEKVKTQIQKLGISGSLIAL